MNKKKSGRRGSNSRPQPWQGCALPTELLPHCLSDFDGAKVDTFIDTTKFFCNFFLFFLQSNINQ